MPTPRTNYTPNSEPAGGRLSTKLYPIDMVEIATAIAELSLTAVPNMAALKSVASVSAALSASSGMVRVLGYYSPEDGGGGVFRWDSSDTTSTDNGGTIITPTSGLSSSGRWKRVYEGEVNARWFGMNPSQTDNTAAHQKFAAYLCSVPCSGFIPAGTYNHKFLAGTSGLSTITINANDVLIRGEGRATKLAVVNNARPNQVNYFYTIAQTGIRGQGGGVRDLCFSSFGNLKWGVYLGTWRDIEFRRLSGLGLHGGFIDAQITTALYGESVVIDHLDHSGPSDTGPMSQFGIRFRNNTTYPNTTWSDCSIRDCDFIHT